MPETIKRNSGFRMPGVGRSNNQGGENNGFRMHGLNITVVSQQGVHVENFSAYKNRNGIVETITSVAQGGFRIFEPRLVVVPVEGDVAGSARAYQNYQNGVGRAEARGFRTPGGEKRRQALPPVTSQDEEEAPVEQAQTAKKNGGIGTDSRDGLRRMLREGARIPTKEDLKNPVLDAGAAVAKKVGRTARDVGRGAGAVGEVAYQRALTQNPAARLGDGVGGKAGAVGALMAVETARGLRGLIRKVSEWRERRREAKANRLTDTGGETVNGEYFETDK